MKNVTIEADVCIVGGGMAGICAAIAAARHGADTVLVQDRPVLGGNASSECRVHIQGADCHGGKKDARETGILEELQLENLHRNPQKSYSIWDTILYEKTRYQDGLTLLLNCAVLEAEMDGNRIVSVTGYQTTTQKMITVRAKLFADCSGDSVLAPLTGAEFRVGREARSEFSEPAAPEVADRKTMGMSCLFGARPTDKPQPFARPSWAYEFPSDDCFPHRSHGHLAAGYWWLELGGEQDSIHDTEETRDELLKITYGMWDHLKNHGEHGAENWVLDWVQFLPGKRESRRYVGDHLLKQNEVREAIRFDDTVAYTGWPMDLHPPGGFFHHGPPAEFNEVPKLCGVPYRCLYSKNIQNLFFAGRNVSCTHVAMGSTRVMGAGAVMGQAVGTAAAIAAQQDVLPRAVGVDHLRTLQQTLLRDDCFLLDVPREFGALTTQAQITASAGEPAALRDGIGRPYEGQSHAWECAAGDTVEYAWPEPQKLSCVKLTFDSNLTRPISLTHHGVGYPLDTPPPELVKDFRLEAQLDGAWREVHQARGNHQRFVAVPLDVATSALRFAPESTWGEAQIRVFALEVE